MYGQLVRVIWECKRFLNWLVSIRNWPKLFATRYKINKYKVLHIVLYASYAYKNKNRTMSFQSFQLNCPAADLFCRLRNLKNKEGVYWCLLFNYFLRKRLIPAHNCCNFASKESSLFNPICTQNSNVYGGSLALNVHKDKCQFKTTNLWWMWQTFLYQFQFFFQFYMFKIWNKVNSLQKWRRGPKINWLK